MEMTAGMTFYVALRNQFNDAPRPYSLLVKRSTFMTSLHKYSHYSKKEFHE